MSGVLFVIKYKDGIILQKRDSTYPRFPNQWTTMGGAIEEGEQVFEAANREVKEEFGIKILLEYIGKYTFNFQPPETLPVFTGEIDDLSRIRLGEGIGFAVFTKDELHKVENDEIRRVVKEIMKW